MFLWTLSQAEEEAKMVSAATRALWSKCPPPRGKEHTVKRTEVENLFEASAAAYSCRLELPQQQPLPPRPSTQAAATKQLALKLSPPSINAPLHLLWAVFHSRTFGFCTPRKCSTVSSELAAAGGDPSACVSAP